MKKNKNWLVLIFGLVLLLGLGQAAQAILVAPPGPPDPNTTALPPPGFGVPLWYQDANGLRLELCLPNAAEQAAGACINAPVPVFPIAFPNNFPDESFWFAATPNQLVVPANGALAVPGKGILVLALELAFAQGGVVDGDQIVFSRLRYRIDVPVAGQYTVTTPYGIFSGPSENVTTPGIAAINVSRDIGVNPGVYTGALFGDIGPFLRPSLTPGGGALGFFTDPLLRPGASYLSPPGAVGPVTGGTTGNIFRVDGPAGSNFGGTGVDFLQTDQFALQGRVFNGKVPTPLSGALATYRRPAVGTGFVDVSANSAATAIVTIAPAGQIPATPMLTDPGTGKFAAHIPITQTTILPDFLSVTAVNPSLDPFNSPTTIGPNLMDLVTVTAAEYDPFVLTLTIRAVSSDEVFPPVLTATGFGNLTSGNITVNNVNAPPTTVTVTSSKGGSGTHAVISVPPVSGTRATYCRPAVGNGVVEAFAKSAPTATLTVSDPTGQVPTMTMATSPIPLVPSDPSYGKFFAQTPITGSTILPATLTIKADNTATNPSIPPVSVGVDLEDLVTITLAEYDPVNKILNIQAN